MTTTPAKGTRVSVHVPPALYALLQEKAQADRSVADVIVEVLESSLSKAQSVTVPEPHSFVVKSGNGTSFTYVNYVGVESEVTAQLEPNRRPPEDRPGAQMRIVGAS